MDDIIVRALMPMPGISILVLTISLQSNILKNFKNFVITPDIHIYLWYFATVLGQIVELPTFFLEELIFFRHGIFVADTFSVSLRENKYFQEIYRMEQNIMCSFYITELIFHNKFVLSVFIPHTWLFTVLKYRLFIYISLQLIKRYLCSNQ